MAYTHIETQTLTTAVGTVSFTSIPQTFRDLYLTANVQALGDNSNVNVRFNGVTAISYATTELYNSGASVLSFRGGGGLLPLGYMRNNARAFHSFELLNYSGTTNNKSGLVRWGDTDLYTYATATRWNTTAAITSISLFTSGGPSFAVGSSFSLWGVSA